MPDARKRQARYQGLCTVALAVSEARFRGQILEESRKSGFGAASVVIGFDKHTAICYNRPCL